MVDDKALGEWCHQHLQDGLGSVLFRSGHLSEVVGVQLNSGRQVVIKARPYDPASWAVWPSRITLLGPASRALRH